MNVAYSKARGDDFVTRAIGKMIRSLPRKEEIGFRAELPISPNHAIWR